MFTVYQSDICMNLRIFATAFFLSLTTLIAGTFAETAEAPSFRMLRSNLISGLIPDINDTYGVAFRDLNEDHYPDMYLVCFRNLNRLLINNGGIIPFIDRTIYSGLGGNLMQHGSANLEVGVSIADYDNDGKPDVFLAGWSKTLRLFRNLGQVRFQDVTARLNLHGVVDANFGVWFDANNDGYLDLYITDEHHANRFLLNQKDGTFKEKIWTYDFLDSATSEGACAADFDGDGDMDLYVCNWFLPDYFLLNDGTGVFRLAHLPLPTLTRAFNSNSATAADLDNDGDPDLLVTTKEGKVFWYRNQSQNGQLRFSPVNHAPFLDCGHDAYGVIAEDLNNDGWLDLFLTLIGPNRLYLNTGEGSFSTHYDTDHRNTYSTGAAAADLDRDGDLDLLVGNKDEMSQVFLNPTNNRHFVELQLVGVRSNRDAIGGKVFFYINQNGQERLLGMRLVTGQTGYLSSRSPVVHFGTDTLPAVNARVVFPSGRERILTHLIPGRRYRVLEYPAPISAVYFILNRLNYLIHQKESWYVVILALLLALLLAIYLRLGIHRYHFSAFTISLQLGTWFVVIVFLFIALHNRPLHWPLLAINVFSVLSVAVTAFFSEQQRKRRYLHQSFRQRLRNLSQQMLHIHDEKTLFANLLQTLQSSSFIQQVFILLAKGSAAFEVLPGSARVTLPSAFLEQLKENSLLFSRLETLQSITSPNVNVAIPVRSNNTILAIIALQMTDKDDPINREDLNLLQQLANQTAIALENIHYIEHTARLTREITESRLQKKYLKQLEATNRELDEKNKQLTRLFKELREKESQLIHSEKMAALGQMVAGISHELNNPVSFIYANSRALEEALNELKTIWNELPLPVRSNYATQFQELMADIRAIISDNLKGSQSIRELVQQLKNFSRIDQAQWKKASIIEGLESTLRLLKHQMGEGIRVIKKYEANPEIYCNPAQLNQVFTNLLLNAIQAIDGKGTITIRTFIEKDHLFIRFTDTGKGIPAKVLPKIFDPFFTTKDVNQGTGLGLSISYSIIEKHGGTIEVESQEGQGTTITLILPLNRSKPEATNHE